MAGHLCLLVISKPAMRGRCLPPHHHHTLTTAFFAAHPPTALRLPGASRHNHPTPSADHVCCVLCVLCVALFTAAAPGPVGCRASDLPSVKDGATPNPWSCGSPPTAPKASDILLPGTTCNAACADATQRVDAPTPTTTCNADYTWSGSKALECGEGGGLGHCPGSSIGDLAEPPREGEGGGGRWSRMAGKERHQTPATHAEVGPAAAAAAVGMVQGLVSVCNQTKAHMWVNPSRETGRHVGV
jgi:hypothetical protein